MSKRSKKNYWTTLCQRLHRALSCTVSLESMKTRNKLAASYQSYCSLSMNNTNSAVIRDLFLITSQLQKLHLHTKNIVDMKTKYNKYYFVEIDKEIALEPNVTLKDDILKR